MGRPKKGSGVGLEHQVVARISTAEKAALDRLIAERAAILRGQGITNQDTFSSWLRSVIRDRASAAGYPVEDDAPAPSVPAKKGGARQPRKAK